MAPFHLWPVLCLTLPVLVWLIDGALAAPPSDLPAYRFWSWRGHPAARAGLDGWWFGFGYFFAGLLWIGEAFLVEAEIFGFLLPFAVTLMPAGLSLFWAGAAAVATRQWPAGFARVVVLALTLSAAEWLRGHVLTGFPWNVLGYALTYPLPFMQSAALIGVYGLTLVTVVVLASPLVLLVDAVEQDDRVAGRGALRLTAMVTALPLLLMLVWGVDRLSANEAPAEPAIRLRIVQPSVVQREKWRPEHQERIFREHLDLSRRAGDGVIDGARGVHLIVWPEAAMPFLPLNTPAALTMIGDMLPEDTVLLSGALRLDSAPGGRRRIYNSLLAFGAGGRPVGAYDKIHLVPFGEYLPAQAWLEAIGLEQLARLRGGFETGARPRPLMSLPGLPKLLPLICYEAIFPHAIVQGGVRPAALVNVTNDGWFGNSTGPRQHMHQARVRAVEEGLPMIRAANNGISALIDGRGRVLGRLDLEREGQSRRRPAAAPARDGLQSLRRSRLCRHLAGLPGRARLGTSSKQSQSKVVYIIICYSGV